MIAPLVLPDTHHVRRCDAEDVASELKAFIFRCKGKRVAFYIDPLGACLFSTADEPNECEPFALVGVYDISATIAQITDDILAMGREAIA